MVLKVNSIEAKEIIQTSGMQPAKTAVNEELFPTEALADDALLLTDAFVRTTPVELPQEQLQTQEISQAKQVYKPGEKLLAEDIQLIKDLTKKPLIVDGVNVKEAPYEFDTIADNVAMFPLYGQWLDKPSEFVNSKGQTVKDYYASYVYDKKGNKILEFCKEDSSKPSELDTSGYLYKYNGEKLSEVVSYEEDATVGYTKQYIYGENNLVTILTTFSSGSQYEDYEQYDEKGRLFCRYDEHEVVTNIYDDKTGNVTTEHRDADGRLIRPSYTLDKNGNLVKWRNLSIVTDKNGHMMGGVKGTPKPNSQLEGDGYIYHFDEKCYLTKVVPQDGTETIEYQYDARGNVSKITCNDTDGYACLTTLDYNDKNECIDVDAVYSKNGNVITEEEYRNR